MSIRVRDTREFWAGGAYTVLGAATVWISWDYPVGSTTRMGPGYFPLILGSLLVILGLIALVRSVFRHGELIGRVCWRGLLSVTGGTVLFALLLESMGLLVALPMLAIVSARASHQFHLGWFPILGVVALTLLCSLVFVLGLEVQLPLLGSWLTS